MKDKKIIANPINITPSLRGATLVVTKQSFLCHPCESRDLDSRLRGNDNLQLLRSGFAPPRNDASLLWLNANRVNYTSYIKFYLCLLVLLISNIVTANNEALPTKKIAWSFDGIFASVDRKAAQRGFQVYKEVCSVCHGLYNLYYRNLKELGFSDEEIKEIAKNYTVQDGPNDSGEMFERPALPSDPFVRPYHNEQAARAANNGADPPDLSLIIKARPDGANYVYSILTGYTNPPENFKLMPGLSYNPYFPHSQIAMPSPLTDGQVQYIDGTNSSVEQMAMDVTVFLQWAAEPEMENRKSMGLKVMIFLVIFTIFFYISKNRIWQDVKL